MSLENEYLLKFYVKHFTIRDETEDNQITIDVDFENRIIPLESSGTDFEDLCKGICITVIATQEDLLSRMKNIPLNFVLKKFATGVEVGSSKIAWPNEILTDFEKPDFKHSYKHVSYPIIHCEEDVGDITVYLAVKNIPKSETETPSETPLKGKSLISYKNIEKYEAEEILYSLENFLEKNEEEDNEKYVLDNGNLYKCRQSPPKKLSTIKEHISTIVPYKCICNSNPLNILDKSSYVRPHRPGLLQRPSSLNINPEDLMRKWCDKIREKVPDRPKTVGCQSDIKEVKKSNIKFIKKPQEKKISKIHLEKEFKLNKICANKLKSFEKKDTKLRKPKLCSEKPISKRKYSYKFGKKHPGVVLGHRNCVGYGGPVPHNMGWLWNVQIPGLETIRKGWRPGAVKKPIKELMSYFLEPCPCDTLPVTKKVKRRFPFQESNETLTPKPTLRIQRKDGNLFVTMNPIKNLVDLKNTPDPYLKCKPIQFQISQDPNILKRSQIKKNIKKCGFRRCVCDKTIAECICKNDGEKFEINEKLNIFSAAYNAESLMKARNQSPNIDSSAINQLKVLYEKSKCDSLAVRKLKSVLVKGKLGAFMKEVVGERKLNELLFQNKFNEIFASVNLNELTDCGRPNKLGEEINLNDPTTTDESELDIEFTPPVGFIRPGLRKKNLDRVVQETQYDEKDFQLPKIPLFIKINDEKKNMKNDNVKSTRSKSSKKLTSKQAKDKLDKPDRKTEPIEVGGKKSKKLKNKPRDEKDLPVSTKPKTETNPKNVSKNNPGDTKVTPGKPKTATNPKIDAKNNPAADQETQPRTLNSKKQPEGQKKTEPALQAGPSRKAK